MWSAPNYCYRCGNVASILEFKSTDCKEAKIFAAVPDSERVIPPRTSTPYFLWCCWAGCHRQTASVLLSSNYLRMWIHFSMILFLSACVWGENGFWLVSSFCFSMMNVSFFTLELFLTVSNYFLWSILICSFTAKQTCDGLLIEWLLSFSLWRLCCNIY